ncbi:phenylacetate--CoA ligase family protein [Thermodesulfobacteriota bacterium]
MVENKSNESSYWEEAFETAPRHDLESLQLKRLRENVQSALSVEFYKEKFNSSSIDPTKIASIDAIRHLPFTTKEDMRSQFPYGLLAVPLKDCVRVHASSGTTGSSVAVFHTQKDIDTWSNLVARCLYGVGVRESDIFQNMGGYGLFTGGLGFHYGAQKVGALTIPAGAGNSKRQVDLMVNFGTTVAHIMPSFALYLIKVFKEMGVDPRRDTKLKTFFLGAESHSEETRNRIEVFYGVNAYNSYGLSEMNGPGVSFECPCKEGVHIWEDNFIIEIIDPEGDEPVPAGKVGELVFTSLARQAMPLIRYRSRDLAFFIPEPCICGRTHCRISRIQGRIDDMIIWKGVNIFPMQIDSILMDIREVEGTYRIVLDTDNDVDTMTVLVEVNTAHIKGDKSEGLQRRITNSLQSELLVKPEVRLVPAGTIPVSEMEKEKRVIDNRSL